MPVAVRYGTAARAAPIAALVFAAPAMSLPGDASVTPLSPADGATVSTAGTGIPISYSCPGYGDTVDPLFGLLRGSAKDYTAVVSAAPATAADGRLANPIRTTSFVPIGAEPATCESTFGGLGDFADPRPHRQHGEYWWQVWRRCGGCPGGVEAGPVWRFTVTLAGRLSLAAVKVGYVGFPLLVRVTFADGAPGEGVVVERRAGTSWTRVAEATRIGDTGPAELTALARLPRGVHRLRASVTSGGSTLASREVLVTIRPAVRAPRRSLDGAYRDRPSLRLAVAGGGTTIRGFRTQVTLTCPSASGMPTVRPGLIDLPRLPIAPDGRFASAFALAAGTSAWIEGRQVGRAVTGYAGLRVGGCSGDLRFTARRT